MAPDAWFLNGSVAGPWLPDAEYKSQTSSHLQNVVTYTCREGFTQGGGQGI